MLPNVIIAGAPRCGTTSLFEYLSAHPDVSVSNVKETCFFIDEHYFSSDSIQSKMPKYFSHPISEYEKYFQDATQNEKIILEASPDYLYQDASPTHLSQLKTKPKIIFILRKPSERAYSLYKFARGQLGLVDHDTSFKNFIESIRLTSKYKKDGYKMLSDAIENGKYINYLIKFIKKYDSERILIYKFEDLKTNPNLFMENVANDLEIDGSFFKEYGMKTTNQSIEIKSQLIQKMVKIAPIPISLRLGDSTLKRIFRAAYRKLNTTPKKNKNTEVLKELKKLDMEYSESIIALEKYLALDLNNWK